MLLTPGWSAAGPGAGAGVVEVPCVFGGSWRKGRVVTPISVVPEASKKTASGATPEVRVGTRDKTMPPGQPL